MTGDFAKQFLLANGVLAIKGGTYIKFIFHLKTDKEEGTEKTLEPEHFDSTQVWSLTQFYSVDFSKSRIVVKKCVFYKRTI